MNTATVTATHYAHYFASKSGAYVIISTAPHTQHAARVAEIAVSGKREARKVAAEHAAKPWNF